MIQKAIIKETGIPISIDEVMLADPDWNSQLITRANCNHTEIAKLLVKHGDAKGVDHAELSAEELFEVLTNGDQC